LRRSPSRPISHPNDKRLPPGKLLSGKPIRSLDFIQYRFIRIIQPGQSPDCGAIVFSNGFPDSGLYSNGQ